MSTYNMIPMDQISTAPRYFSPLKISGAIYKGVPMAVDMKV